MSTTIPAAPRMAAALALAAGALFAAGARAPSPPTGDGRPPAWLTEHMQFVAREGGRWVADNSAYRGPNEDFEAYGMEWTWGLGRASQRGRMFALRDGEEVATVWELVLYWHPGEGQALTLQMGRDGTLAAGELRPVEASELESIDTFHHPDGTSKTVRHRFLDEGDEWAMQAWECQGEEWVEGRSYVWIRQR